ncbi:hypothetical protein PLICRDRAFT_289346 [Plicaturopsis crispa FD-325 SS-3]|nr:hypothetical protein PLICRDRAFT_289346 [Plicaturopsis crispa FD-325 SS-3]
MPVLSVSAQNRLNEIGARVERLRATRDVLQCQRDELKRQQEVVESSLAHGLADMAEIKNTEAPIASLPPELLCMIFEAGARMDARFRTLVTLVSRHWKSVAVSSVELWTTVSIDTSFPVDEISVLEDILRRTGTAELSLTLLARVYDNISDTRTTAFMDVVCSQIYRVRQLVIKTQDVYVPPDVLRRLEPLSAPVLRTLALRGRYSHHSLSYQYENPLFSGGAPFLRSLDYDDIHWRVIPCAALHYRSITSLSVYCLDERTQNFSGLREFLRNFVALEKFYAREWLINDWPEDISPFYDSVTLPAL